MDHYGKRLERMRKDAGLALRELSRRAQMSPASLSAIEKGRSSPTLATLHKLLRALDMDFVQFFAPAHPATPKPVFTAAEHHTLEDHHRRYVFLLPRSDQTRFELLLETLAPTETERDAEWETHDCDLGGYVLAGGPARLEIDGVDHWTVHKGDSFYVKAGCKHRAVNLGSKPLQLVTVFDPPRY